MKVAAEWTAGLPKGCAWWVTITFDSKEALTTHIKEKIARGKHFMREYGSDRPRFDQYDRIVAKWVGVDGVDEFIRELKRRDKDKKERIKYSANLRVEDRLLRKKILERLTANEALVLGWNKDGTHAPLKSRVAKIHRLRSSRRFKLKMSA